MLNIISSEQVSFAKLKGCKREYAVRLKLVPFYSIEKKTHEFRRFDVIISYAILNVEYSPYDIKEFLVADRLVRMLGTGLK